VHLVDDRSAGAVRVRVDSAQAPTKAFAATPAFARLPRLGDQGPLRDAQAASGTLICVLPESGPPAPRVTLVDREERKFDFVFEN